MKRYGMTIGLDPAQRAVRMARRALDDNVPYLRSSTLNVDRSTLRD
jgi:hypothetical protein